MERIKLHLIVFTSVIDLYRKHFESNSYLTHITSPTTFLSFEMNTWEDLEESIKD